MPWAVAGAAVGGAMNSGANYLGQDSNREQYQNNLANAGSLVQGQQDNNGLALQAGNRDIQGGLQNTIGSLSQYGGYQRNAINNGMNQAANAYGYGSNQALGNVSDAYTNAINATNTGYSGAMGSVNAGYGQQQSQLGNLAQLSQYGQQAVATPLGSGYQQSPGMQFQLQQGQQSLDRQQAASGGRYSGAAMKAGLQFSQGVANQDYQQYVGNDLAQRGMMMQLGQTGYNAQNALANSYGQQGNVLAGLQTGQAGQLAGLNTGMGNNLAQINQGGGQYLGNLYAGGASQLASSYGQQGGNIANAYTGAANNMANSQLQYSQLNSGMTGSLVNPTMNVPYRPGNLQVGLGVVGGAIGAGASMLGGMQAGGK